jgi:hypothetical protein
VELIASSRVVVSVVVATAAACCRQPVILLAGGPPCFTRAHALTVCTMYSNGPFPIATNTLQQQFARLLQDLKRTRATSDVLAAVASSFFGGSKADFALRNVQFTDYHIRQTSRRVIRHGVQVSRARRFQPFSYGFEENLRRYGSPAPPRYAYVVLIHRRCDSQTSWRWVCR